MADQGPLNFDPLVLVLLALVAIHVGVLVAAIRFKRPAAMLWLTLAFAVLILLAGLASGGFIKMFGVLGLMIMAAELAAGTAAVAGLNRVRHAITASWVAFGCHCLAAVAIAIFAMTFQMRLF